MITSGLSFNVFNMSEAATNPFNFCVRLIKISILYLSPVVSAGFFVCFSWREYSSPERNTHWLKCQCQAAAKRAIRSILSANCTPPCGCRTRSTGFPSASSNLDSFDTVALSRTHPTPSETTTHPDRAMKRFKKKTLSQHHKNLNNTTPSPSFHRPNKKPRKQHAPPNFQADD